MYSRASLLLLVILTTASLIEIGDAAKRQRPDYRLVERSYDSGDYLSLPGVNVATRYPDALTVRGRDDEKISDLDLVLIGFSHGAPKDVDVLLVAPNGRAALVMADAGGEGDVMDVTIRLDQNAKSRLPRTGPLTSGSFRPVNFRDGEVAEQPSNGGNGASGGDGSAGGDGTSGGDGQSGGDGEPGGSGSIESDLLPEPAPDRVPGSSLAVFNGMNPAGEWRLFIRADGPAAGSLAGWELQIETKVRRR